MQRVVQGSVAIRSVGTVLLMVLSLAGSLRADLKQVLAERNLQRRSILAVENAVKAYQTMRTAYETGELEAVSAAATEIQESVQVAHAALVSTGKDPRKSPKYFKKAEIDLRDLVKRLTGFQHQMDFSDRPMLDKVKATVERIHDELLVGLMQGKKR